MHSESNMLRDVALYSSFVGFWPTGPCELLAESLHVSSESDRRVGSDLSLRVADSLHFGDTGKQQTEDVVSVAMPFKKIGELTDELDISTNVSKA